MFTQNTDTFKNKLIYHTHRYLHGCTKIHNNTLYTDTVNIASYFNILLQLAHILDVGLKQEASIHMPVRKYRK